MPVDPQAQAILDLMASANIDITNMQPHEARAIYDLPGSEAPQEVGNVNERMLVGPLGDIPVRIYTPQGDGPYPLLLFYHGGGFVLGNLDTHDELCRSICFQAKCVVVAVDYRLAPEHKYPAAPEDCYAATLWAEKHASELNCAEDQLVVAGDSAGGNMAAVVCLMARDRGAPRIKHQLLLYPVTERNFETQSYLDNAEGFFLSRRMMQWFWQHYLQNDEDSKQAYAAPLLAEELGNLPASTVITAEYDPLRDEGEAYAQRLLAAGVKTELIRYNGMIHGFMSFGDAIDAGKGAVTTVCEKLRAAVNA